MANRLQTMAKKTTSKNPPLQAQDKLTFSAVARALPDGSRPSERGPGTPLQHFGMPEEQIPRGGALLIGVSGIPGETAQYQHEDLFRYLHGMTWRRTTRSCSRIGSPSMTRRDSLLSEAAALIAGLQYLSALPEDMQDCALAIATLMAKLSRRGIRNSQPGDGSGRSNRQ